MFPAKRIALFLWCFILAVSARGQLLAGFTVSSSNGCAPLLVYFTNTSTGATSYTWSFGNGSPNSAFINPSTSYLSPGTYTVTLTAQNGSNTSVATKTITVNPPPVVNFSSNDTVGCPGHTFSFTDNSTLNAPGFGSYSWNFGDGQGSSLQNPTHTYTSSGYYNVTLTVTNSNGCNSTLVKSSYIHIFTPPVPNFAANSTSFCHPPGNAVFANTSTGFGTLTYLWRFGDGSTISASNPSHTYTSPGHYTVTLIDTDGHGCIDSLVNTNYIFVSNLTGSFSGTGSACIYDSVFFQNTTPQNYISSSWSFGNGGTSLLDSPGYVYSSSGTFNVTLIVSDSSCSDTIIHPITIYPEPVATISNPPYCPIPVTVPFTSTAPTGSTYLWSFGDGGSSILANPSHPYNFDTLDTVRLIVTDIHGCKDTVTKVDSLYKLYFHATADINGGCIPVTFHFWIPPVLDLVTHYPDPPYSNTLTWPNSPIVSKVWSFGDGSPNSTLDSPIHTYTVFGTYNVILSVVFANGCTAADTIQVHAGTPPVASFTESSTHICTDKEITFTCTSPVFTNVIWTLGDGTTTVDNPEVHKYLMPGIYTVKLIVYNNGCPDSITKTNLITVDSGKAILGYALNCDTLLKVNFFDSSIGATSQTWIFGDNTTSQILDPVHTYPSPAVYTVALAIYDSLTGCRDTDYVTLNLTKPQPTIAASDTAVCKNAIVHFTSTPNGIRTASFWYINGILKDTTANYTDTFFQKGIYTVLYRMRDQNGCYDTVLKTNYITVAKPHDSFSVSPAQGCKDLSVLFTDLSTDVSGTSISNRAWSFGDAATASVAAQTISHTYTSKGIYNVKLIVTDNIGCKDTLKMDSLIRVYKPKAAFHVNDSLPCRGQLVTFVNTTLDTLSAAYWQFGDGGTMNTIQTAHTYTQNGVFTTTLIVTDTHGCKDTLTKPNYISIATPNASFYMNDSIAICPPLQVFFTNTSIGAQGYYWSFGNGPVSYIQNPTNSYPTPGVYLVMMIASNSQGCTDTAYGHATLYGFSGSLSYSPLIGCSPLTVQFTANVNNVPSVIWDFNDGSTSALLTTYTTTHTYTIPGAFVPKLIMNGTGCQASSNGIDTIKVDAVKAGFTTNPYPVCVHGQFNFKDTSSSLFSSINNWFWKFDKGTTSNVRNPQHVYDSIGTYIISLVIKDIIGCADSLSKTITVFPSPTITASNDTVICMGDAVNLYAAGGVSYVWTPAVSLSCSSCQSPLASPNIPTEYLVTGTDINGCKNKDSVHVGIKTKTTALAGIGGNICRRDSIQLKDSGAQYYTWYPSAGLSNNQIPDPVASPSVSTRYIVIAKQGTCIPDTNYVQVTVNILPTVTAGSDVTIFEGSTTVLQASGTNVKTYVWYPAESLSCDSCPDPTANVHKTTTFTLKGYTDFGCVDSAHITVRVLCDKGQVFIPNSFTPNGDGQNDLFYPRGQGIKIINSFRIYDRWGELVFERKGINVNDESNAWDGTYKGGKPRPDVYVYSIDAVCEAGDEINWKGDVTVIR